MPDQHLPFFVVASAGEWIDHRSLAVAATSLEPEHLPAMGLATVTATHRTQSA